MTDETIDATGRWSCPVALTPRAYFATVRAGVVMADVFESATRVSRIWGQYDIMPFCLQEKANRFVKP